MKRDTHRGLAKPLLILSLTLSILVGADNTVSAVPIAASQQSGGVSCDALNFIEAGVGLTCGLACVALGSLVTAEGAGFTAGAGVALGLTCFYTCAAPPLLIGLARRNQCEGDGEPPVIPSPDDPDCNLAAEDCGELPPLPECSQSIPCQPAGLVLCTTSFRWLSEDNYDYENPVVVCPANVAVVRVEDAPAVAAKWSSSESCTGLPNQTCTISYVTPVLDKNDGRWKVKL